MKTDKKIAYFVGCTTNYIDPEVGVSTIQVLKKNGFQPIIPDQKCCGTAHLASGNISSFLKHAEFNVRSLSDADCDIVTACTSCALTLKQDYPRLLGSREAKVVSQRTYDIMEYLVLLKDSEVLNNNFKPVTLRVMYHAPCHLKVRGEELVDQRLKLMKSIPGLSISCIEKGCCGMGGTFGMKKKNYHISMQIGRPLFDEIKETAPDLIATDCPGCKMQIQQGSGLDVTHPILIVKQAYEIIEGGNYHV